MPISFQAESPVLGLVLPSNSPGVHTLWLPVIPMQIGLVLKPGPQEPWTPFRMAEAFFQAGIPREAISIYPGEGDVGAAVLDGCARSLIFGGTPTVDRYRGNPRVQAHGPGFSKILLGDDQVDQWEKYLDVMVDSVFANSGRGCINCSGIWASRHGREIADAIAKRLAACGRCRPIIPSRAWRPSPFPASPTRSRRRSTPTCRRPASTDVTASYARRRRASSRTAGPSTCCRPSSTATSPDAAIAKKEYMFPFVTVVDCPEGADAREDRPDARVQRHHLPARVPARARRRGAHRSPEPRAGADDSAQLAPAARRQHRRVPVPRARVSVGRSVGPSAACSEMMRILSITAGAGGMYCGSCLRDNALAAELMARGHDVTLLPLYTPLLTDEANVTRRQVLFGGISVYLQQLLRDLPADCRASSIACSTRRG